MVCINRCNSGKCIYAFNRNDCRSLKEKRKNEERRYENEICKNSLRRYSGRGDGIYIPHEHLYAVPPTCQKDRDLEVSDYEGSVAELKLFKSVGGQTLVEASTLDYGRNLSLLKKMSEETGVHVIATTGFNKHIYYPNWVEEKSTEEISDILADDILEGRDGIRAGFIKIGTYYNMIHPLEEKTAVAAAQAQKR